MILMKKQHKNNSKAFIEISEPELCAVVGEDFVLQELNFLLLRTLDYINSSSFSIQIIQNTFDKTFCIYDDNSKQLIALIDKLEFKGHFCKPYLLIHKFAIKILESYKKDLDDEIYDRSKNNIIDELFIINELPDNEKLSDYLYNVTLLLIYQFNLDIIESKIAYFDEQHIILDAIKSEYIYDEKKQELESQDVVYMIDIRTNSNFVNITKIFETNKKETHILDLKDYFMQEHEII